MTTATRTPKNEKIEAIEAMPKFPPDSIEAKALDRLRSSFRVAPGALPPLGAQHDLSVRQRADSLVNAGRAWSASGRNPGYYTEDTVKDSDPLGRAILSGMTGVIEGHGRQAVGDILAEWEILAGRVEPRPGQFPEAVQRLMGELFVIERRLSWLYATLPAGHAAHRPRPYGPLGKRLHDRRAELVGLVDAAFESSHPSAGTAAVNQILGHAMPGTSVLAHALDGWAKVAEAIKFGAEFTPEFAAAWSEVIPAAADSFDGLGELSVYILRCC